MRLISYINGNAAQSLWIWKFLITWSRNNKDFSINFYPDYETSNFEIDVKFYKG